MNAVEVHDLTRRFGKFTAVNNANFYIPEGEIFGLLGPNGAGKTTTIRILCGILLPTSGTATVLNYNVARDPEEVKKRIGYMSQKFSLYNDLTPLENIEFYGSIYGVPAAQRRERSRELIRMVGLEEQEKKLTRNLSGAWRQRLALACAIVHRPPMLFLDEATAGVDPVSRREFWDLIYQLASEGVSVLATTHYMDEADYCNTIGMMYQGEIVALASPETLKEQMPGVLVQLDCDRPGDIAALVGDMPEVMNIAVHGALTHLTLRSKSDAKRVAQVLLKNGIRITSWEEITPSLEDVFITMVAQRQQAAEISRMESERSHA